MSRGLNMVAFMKLNDALQNRSCPMNENTGHLQYDVQDIYMHRLSHAYSVCIQNTQINVLINLRAEPKWLSIH